MQIALQKVELPVRLRPETPMTDEQLMAFCAANEMVRVERESNGDLLLMSPSGIGTSQKNSYIIAKLSQWADTDGRGLVFDSNGGWNLPDGSMRAPDAAWLSWRLWNGLSASDQQRFAPMCPEFVIELRSPSDRLGEQRRKMEIWIRNGAALGWLLDAKRQVVEVYRPGREPEVFEGQSAVYGDGPVDGFVLELARVWS